MLFRSFLSETSVLNKYAIEDEKKKKRVMGVHGSRVGDFDPSSDTSAVATLFFHHMHIGLRYSM